MTDDDLVEFLRPQKVWMSKLKVKNMLIYIFLVKGIICYEFHKTDFIHEWVAFLSCIYLGYLLSSLIENHCLFQYVVGGKPKTAVYLLAELMKHDTPVKLSDEHQDFKWVPLETACKLVEHQTLQEVLKECSTFLQRNSV
jgi:hypothetical protein